MTWLKPNQNLHRPTWSAGVSSIARLAVWKTSRLLLVAFALSSSPPVSSWPLPPQTSHSGASRLRNVLGSRVRTKEIQ